MAKEKKEKVEDAKVVAEPVENTAEKQPEGPGKIFDFADVHFYCNQCGTDNKVADALRGISFTVPAAEHADVKMECTNCGNLMKLYFVESSEEAKAKRKAEIEEMEKADQAANNEIVNDGTSQENKEDESGQGSSDDSERTVEANKETAGDPVDADAVRQSVEA
jgi:rubredoxin